jgi:hypothetical protein
MDDPAIAEIMLHVNQGDYNKEDTCYLLRRLNALEQERAGTKASETERTLHNKVSELGKNLAQFDTMVYELKNKVENIENERAALFETVLILSKELNDAR